MMWITVKTSDNILNRISFLRVLQQFWSVIQSAVWSHFHMTNHDVITAVHTPQLWFKSSPKRCLWMENIIQHSAGSGYQREHDWNGDLQMSIFLLKSHSDTLQNIHFNVFVIVMCFINCKSDIWAVKSECFTLIVQQKLFLTLLI